MRRIQLLVRGFSIPVGVLIVAGIGFGYIIWKKHQTVACRRKVTVRKKGHGSIHIITSVDEWEEVYPLLARDTRAVRVVGLDCEWVFSEFFRHPVALLQISTQQGLCLLVRLCHMTSQLPHSLKQFLTDKTILKVGVAVKEDGKKLFRDHGLPVNGCIDLRHMLSRVPNIYTCKTMGLQGLAKGILDVHLDKNEDVRCGNWESSTLNEHQVQYAASDAVVGVDIFTKLVLSEILKGDPDTVYPPGSQSVTEEEFHQVALVATRTVVDVPFVSHRLKTDGQKQVSIKTSHTGKVDHGPRAYSARQRPLDFNCQLMSPSGKMLCRCDCLRAEWYLEKNLGKKISDDPFIVQLKYEPEEGTEDDNIDDLYEDHGDSKGMCVVCGRTDAFIRKFVIPTEYRRFFPRVRKSARRSHNIIVLCPACYQVSSQHDTIVRQTLAVECSAPLDSGSGSKTVKDRELQKVQAAAKALKLNRDKIPVARVQELETTLKDFYGVDMFSSELVVQALDMDITVTNSSYVPHGKKVVAFYQENNRLYVFERMWRKHFLDTMQPKHLPPFWQVDFRNIQLGEDEDRASSSTEI